MGYNGPLPWLLLSSQTASNSASISFTSQIVSSYSSYVLLFSNVIPITAGSNLQLQVSTNGGSTYVNSGYESGVNRLAYNANTVTNTTATTAVLLTSPISTTGGASGFANFYNMQNGSNVQIVGTQIVIDNGSSNAYTGYTLASTGTSSVNALQITMSSGNISTGRFSLFAIVE